MTEIAQKTVNRAIEILKEEGKEQSFYVFNDLEGKERIWTNCPIAPYQINYGKQCIELYYSIEELDPKADSTYPNEKHINFNVMD